MHTRAVGALVGLLAIAAAGVQVDGAACEFPRALPAALSAWTELGARYRVVVAIDTRQIRVQVFEYDFLLLTRILSRSPSCTADLDRTVRVVERPLRDLGLAPADLNLRPPPIIATLTPTITSTKSLRLTQTSTLVSDKMPRVPVPPPVVVQSSTVSDLNKKTPSIWGLGLHLGAELPGGYLQGELRGRLLWGPWVAWAGLGIGPFRQVSVQRLSITRGELIAQSGHLRLGLGVARTFAEVTGILSIGGGGELTFSRVGGQLFQQKNRTYLDPLGSAELSFERPLGVPWLRGVLGAEVQWRPGADRFTVEGAEGTLAVPRWATVVRGAFWVLFP